MIDYRELNLIFELASKVLKNDMTLSVHVVSDEDITYTISRNIIKPSSNLSNEKEIIQPKHRVGEMVWYLCGPHHYRRTDRITNVDVSNPKPYKIGCDLCPTYLGEDEVFNTKEELLDYEHKLWVDREQELHFN